MSLRNTRLIGHRVHYCPRDVWAHCLYVIGEGDDATLHVHDYVWALTSVWSHSLGDVSE